MSRRPKRIRETREYGAMVRRMIRAYGRRVAAQDVEELAGLVALREELDEAIQTAVDGLRTDYSWAELARPLGCSRQNAQKRWGR